MTDAPEGKAREITSRCTGVLVAIVAVVLASAPFMGKAYLRSRVPPVSVPAQEVAESTEGFLEQQRTEAFDRVMSMATQLDSGINRLD
jgi:hypothetical protein